MPVLADCTKCICQAHIFIHLTRNLKANNFTKDELHRIYLSSSHLDTTYNLNCNCFYPMNYQTELHMFNNNNRGTLTSCEVLLC